MDPHQAPFQVNVQDNRVDSRQKNFFAPGSAEHIDRIAAAHSLDPGPAADWNDARVAAAARVLGD